MTLHDDIQKTIQEHLPKLQSDAVLIRLKQADELERHNAELNNSLKLSSEANVKLRAEVEALKANAVEQDRLVSWQKRLEGRESDVEHKIHILEAVTAERDKHEAKTHDLLLTLFRNATVRKQTAQVVSTPYFTSSYDQGRQRFDQSGAGTDVVPIQETTTEE